MYKLSVLSAAYSDDDQSMSPVAGGLVPRPSPTAPPGGLGSDELLQRKLFGQSKIVYLHING